MLDCRRVTNEERQNGIVPIAIGKVFAIGKALNENKIEEEMKKILPISFFAGKNVDYPYIPKDTILLKKEN